MEYSGKERDDGGGMAVQVSEGSDGGMGMVMF